MAAGSNMTMHGRDKQTIEDVIKAAREVVSFHISDPCFTEKLGLLIKAVDVYEERWITDPKKRSVAFR